MRWANYFCQITVKFNFSLIRNGKMHDGIKKTNFFHSFPTYNPQIISVKYTNHLSDYCFCWFSSRQTQKNVRTFSTRFLSTIKWFQWVKQSISARSLEILNLTFSDREKCNQFISARSLHISILWHWKIVSWDLN